MTCISKTKNVCAKGLKCIYDPYIDLHFFFILCKIMKLIISLIN